MCRFLLLVLCITSAHPLRAQYGHDLTGQQVRSLWPGDARLAVLFFIATDCPISNRYAPEIHRLQQLVEPQQVAVWLVYPNRTETLPGIRTHRAAFYPEMSTDHILIDSRGDLVRLAGAKVTPEAAVLSPGGVRYIGRIDDRYLSIGNERPQASRHDLEDAVAAALAGRPIPAPGGPPVGCGIVGAR